MGLVLDREWGFIPVKEFIISFGPEKSDDNKGTVYVTLSTRDDLSGIDIATINDSEGDYTDQELVELKLSVERLISEGKIKYPTDVVFNSDTGKLDRV